MKKKFLSLLFTGLLLVSCTGCKAEAASPPQTVRIHRIWVKDASGTVREQTFFRDANGRCNKVTEQIRRG